MRIYIWREILPLIDNLAVSRRVFNISMNDPELSDRLGWNDLVEKFHERIYAFSWHMLGARHEAEDVTQETFLRAYRSRGRLRTSNVKAWLYSIARNACLDRQRWWKRWQIRAVNQTAEQGLVPDSQALLELTQIIERLPVRQREVFVLRHWHGFSTLETADLLGLSEGSVKSHLSRAVEKLKTELSCLDG